MTTPRWFKPEVTLSGAIQIVFLLFTIIGGGITLTNLLNGYNSSITNNANSITALQKVVTDIPGIKSDVLLLQNTVSNRSVARDAQLNALTGRVDKIENSVDAKLDDIAKSLASMQSDVAALNATLRATSRQP